MKRCEFCNISNERLESLKAGEAIGSFMGELTLAHEGAPVAGDWVVGPVIFDGEGTIHIFKVDHVNKHEDTVEYVSSDIVLSEGFDVEKCIAVEVNAHVHD